MQSSKEITALKIQINVILFITLSLFTISSKAQDLKTFRSGYFRLGINRLGSELNQSLSPKENIFKGNYGAGSGFVFESGRVFYFMKKDTKKLVNFGLDWTYISLTYNKMDKWTTYGKNATGSPEFSIDGTKIAAAISGKLGPVLSVNPIEKLVIDLRAQIAPTARYFDFSYAENTNNGTSRSFSFTNETSGDDSFDAESVKNRIAFGFQKSFGLTVRRKAIGLSIDHISGNVKSNYEAQDNTGMSFGKEKIPVNNVQVKVSFTL